MAGKPKEGESEYEAAARRYRELCVDRGWMTKAAAAGIIADETGKRQATIVRYLAYVAEAPRLEQVPAPGESPEEVWQRARELGEKASRRLETAGKATIVVDEAKPIGLLMASDGHVDDIGAALGRVEESAKLVNMTDGLYAGEHGDLRNNFILKALMSAALESRFTPEEQIALVEKYLDLYEPGKLLYVVAGNHDDWERRVSGISTLARMVKERRVLYDADQFFIRLRVGGHEYKLLIRHKGRGNSMYNPTHVCMQAMRMGVADEPPDLVAMGHTHDPAITEFTWYGERRLAVKTGSPKLHDDWARKIGYPPGQYMAPVVIFYPGRRKMLPFWDAEEGADYLTFLRGKR